MLRSTLSQLSYKRRIKEDKKNSERLCAVAHYVMRVLFFLYASMHKIIPSCHPSLRSGSIAFAEKAPSSQKKASARQKRKDQELYLNLYVVQVVFVVQVVVLFSDRRAAFSATKEPFSAKAVEPERREGME